MTQVPAVMAVLGDRAWWIPHRLDRILPHPGPEDPAPAPRVPVAGRV